MKHAAKRLAIAASDGTRFLDIAAPYTDNPAAGFEPRAKQQSAGELARIFHE